MIPHGIEMWSGNVILWKVLTFIYSDMLQVSLKGSDTFQKSSVHVQQLHKQKWKYPNAQGGNGWLEWWSEET